MRIVGDRLLQGVCSLLVECARLEGLRGLQSLVVDACKRKKLRRSVVRGNGRLDGLILH